MKGSIFMKNHQKLISHAAGMNDSTIWRLVPDLLLHMNADGVFLGYNQPKNMKLHLPPDDFINKNVQDVFPAHVSIEGMEKIKKTIENDSIESFYFHLRLGGKLEFFEARFMKYNDKEVLVIVRDVTTIMKMKKRLDFLSNHDTLTKAFNRNYFDQFMNNLKTKHVEKPLGLMICDIDSLKLINDSMGHSTGDELIKSAVRILFSCISKGDSLFRIGGDEFVIISMKQDMAMLKEKIKEAVKTHNKLHSGIYLSMSLGWQEFTEKNSVQEIFNFADNNMYKEKLYNTPRVRENIITNILSILATEDHFNHNNVPLLTYLLKIFAAKLNLSTSVINRLNKLALVYNIGIIGISKSILNQKGLLSEKDQMELRRHCEIGFRILNMSMRYSEIADSVLKHHENWDGTGYPLGLRGYDIPSDCRIFRLAKDFHLMILQKLPNTVEDYENLLTNIKNGSGKIYDPSLTKIFIEVVETNKKEIITYICNISQK